MSKGIKILILVCALSMSLSLFTREEYAAETANVPYETMTYEEYEEIFRDKVFTRDPENSADKQLERLKLYMSEYDTTIEAQDFKLNEAKKLRSMIEIPDSWDWRKDICFSRTQIKDQAGCGSCYSFAATFAFAMTVCIADSPRINFVNLSPQDLLDCDYAHKQCQGGTIPHTWKFIENQGVCAEKCKPYTSGQTGRVNSCTSYCSDYRDTYKKYRANLGSMQSRYTNDDIMLYLVTEGPMVTAMDAPDTMHAYRGGIYVNYNPKNIEGHAVTVVGYGTDRVYGDYWIVANSWGSNWGENGYFKIPFNHLKICQFGVASQYGKKK